MSFEVINNPLVFRIEFDEEIYGDQFETIRSYLKLSISDFKSE